MKVINLSMASGHFFYSRSEIRQGENLASRLNITLSDDFLGYAYNLLFKLNDKTPVLTEPLTSDEDNVINYILTNAVTSEAGILQVELQASDPVTGLLAKSAICRLKVIDSIDGSGEVMPEAYAPWVTVINAAVAAATEQAEIAEGYATTATQQAGLAGAKATEASGYAAAAFEKAEEAAASAVTAANATGPAGPQGEPGPAGPSDAAIYTTVEAISDIFTADISLAPLKNLSITLSDAVSKTIIFSNVPSGRCEIFVELVVSTLSAVIWTLNTGSTLVWASGSAPNLSAGKTYRLLFMSSDSGATWDGFASVGV